MPDLQSIVDEYDWEASGEELASSMRPLHTQLVEMGHSEATMQLESAGIPAVSYDVRRDELDEVVDLLADQVKGVSDTTRERIQTIVDTQNKEGLSIPQTAELLKAGMEIDSTSRARTIARTETAVAYNMGSLLTYGKAGIQKVLVHDGDLDADCAEANGQEWTVEEAAANPIAHPNCRRFFSPILEGIEQPTPAGEPPSGGPLGEADTWEPVGTPVGQALDLPGGKLGKSLERAVSAIESVHGDGVLPHIPVKSSSGTSTLGSYRYTGFGGRALDIKISTKGEHQELTMVHEMGHFLDHQGINTATAPAGEYGTRARAPIYDKFRKAAEESELITGLQDLRKSPTVQVQGSDGKTYTAYVDLTYVHYLTSSVEVWARAYAQYIAVRSGDPALMAQLRKEQASTSPYKQQWSDSDFAPIADSMDDIFRQLGWRKEK